MTTTYKVTWQLNYFTNLPEDVIVNTFCFVWPVGTPTLTNWGNLRDDLLAFYQNNFSIGANLYMAPWLTLTGPRIKAYNLADPEPRTPVYQSTRTMADHRATSTVTTQETAVVLSFQGDPASGVNQATRRGRIYLGGFADIVEPGTSSTFPGLASDVLAGVAANATTLKSATAGHGWVWSVFSRKLGTSQAVTNGWVDDALDTQRRRETPATTRTLWT